MMRGRIVTQLKIDSANSPNGGIHCNALVDTGAAYLVLPSAWREKLGYLEVLGEVALELGDQTRKPGDICGPVKLQMAGFRPIYTGSPVY